MTGDLPCQLPPEHQPYREHVAGTHTERMVIARTERLTLRPMAMTDLDDMAALLGDPEVMRYYPAPKSREEAARWIT